MNVFLHPSKKSRVLLVALLLPLLGWSQNFDPLEQLTVIQGQSIDYVYQSLGAPGLTYIYSSTTSHGSFQGPFPIGGGKYKIRYNSSGSIGTDEMTIVLKKPPQGLLTYRKIEIKIIPSYIAGRKDFAITPSGNAVSIPVTANDTSNRGVLILKDVAMANNGSVALAGNNVVFTPEAGFEGIANFDYIVCDDIGNCDATTVHVCVGDPYGTQNDTLRIFTNKNKSVEVLTPLVGYALTTGPSNGSLQNNGDILTYKPQAGYTGEDVFAYTHSQSGNIKWISVEVLNVAAPNVFVHDDVAYTVIEKPIEINLVDNDLYGSAMYNMQINSSPHSGTVQLLGNGVCYYTPNPGFEGVDEFSYQASPNSNGSNPETGKVYVIVSNQYPNSPVFELSTPRDVPLVINYNIPIEDFDFNITSQGDLGSLVYYPGLVNTIVNGYQIQGYNLLVYVPAQGATGWDEVEVEYCVADNPECPVTKIYVNIEDNGVSADACVGTDCVWAGDANKDGLVDMRDLLPIGQCIGDVGKPRPNASINPWFGQEGQDWGLTLPGSGIDAKHVDMDGDSLITSADTIAIAEHYQKTHSLTPAPVNFPTDVPLFLGAPDTIYVSGPGDIINIPIILGASGYPAKNIYGLTFSVDFDANVIDAQQSRVVFDKNSWMSYNSPILSMVRKPFNGRIEAGYSRTNGAHSSGHGRIGYASFIVIDDLDPGKFASLQMATITGSIINSNGMVQDFAPQNIFIKFGDIRKPLVSNEPEITIFPNPVEEMVNIKIGEGHEMVRVEMYDFSGRQIKNISIPGLISTSLNLGEFETGLYVVKVKTSTGAVIARKLEVVK